MFDAFVKNLDVFAWLGLKGKPKAIRKPHGRTVTRGPHGETVECDTLQCCHCGGHHEIVHGSGRLRGFCNSCFDGKDWTSGFVCGVNPDCWACVPYELQIENVEAGRPKLTPRATSFILNS